MIVGFVGTPCSGKSTIATKMFSSFKESGTNCELIVEVARQYIANKRFEEKLKNQPIVLTDADQQQIAHKQWEVERNMQYSCGTSTIIVSDSSIMNAGLYMSEAAFKGLTGFFKDRTLSYDLIFFCHPINLKSLPSDPNRVHNLEEIKLLNDRANELLSVIKSVPGANVQELLGSITLDARFRDACSITLNKHVELVQRS